MQQMSDIQYLSFRKIKKTQKSSPINKCVLKISIHPEVIQEDGYTEDKSRLILFMTANKEVVMEFANETH